MTFSHKSVFKNPCQKATGSSGFLSMSSLFFLCGTLKINTYFTSSTCCQSLTFCAEGTQSLLGNTVALGNEELGALVRRIVLQNEKQFKPDVHCLAQSIFSPPTPFTPHQASTSSPNFDLLRSNSSPRMIAPRCQQDPSLLSDIDQVFQDGASLKTRPVSASERNTLGGKSDSRRLPTV